jgi:hypothetical protein
VGDVGFEATAAKARCSLHAEVGGAADQASVETEVGFGVGGGIGISVYVGFNDGLCDSRRIRKGSWAEAALSTPSQATLFALCAERSGGLHSGTLEGCVRGGWQDPARQQVRNLCQHPADEKPTKGLGGTTLSVRVCRV